MRRLVSGAGQRSFGGVYPHLASFNQQNECGIGAVVAWADRLWWVTYAPHRPDGSDDGLYAMDAARNLMVWPQSVGGTPANRMIHSESRQLLIGPYLIDHRGAVRVIPPSRMRGRLTGTARHLDDPAHKVYYATMEEGIYSVDLRSLAVTRLFADNHDKAPEHAAGLPGYHGKGLFSGQGVLVYSNNGEQGRAALTRPETPSGVLAQWDGKGSGRGRWQVVRRNQFTEVSGPGGIRGNPNPATDPLWSVGWDHRSLLFMLRSRRDSATSWQCFRLPKASHCYDGAHGWNTEWPRIREVGAGDLLMTMHGMFWRLPRRFDLGQTAGLLPRSSYLKVVADFCRWGEQIVFGCDDAAKSEFLNRRRAKGRLAGPALSQSNLWFVEPAQLDRCGPAIGRGGVWVDDQVEVGVPSDAFLFQGFSHRSVHLAHDAAAPVKFRFEVDAGDGEWRRLDEVAVGAAGYAWQEFAAAAPGAWIRVTVDRRCRATAWFEYRNQDRRSAAAQPLFQGLARSAAVAQRGLLRAGARDQGLQVLVGERCYELRPNLRLVGVASESQVAWMAEAVAIPRGVTQRDGSSMLYIDDAGQRWRLPIGNPQFQRQDGLADLQRASREVVTERDLFQCAGTFFELPARNAGGFAKIRPIATHPYFVHDYCSWRGLLVLSGLDPRRAAADPRVIQSADGKCAVWLGTVDDLWGLGKPRGVGGPWLQTQVLEGQPSDPFLMAGYDHKTLTLQSDLEVSVAIEVDITGTGQWQRYHVVEVAAGVATEYRFPDAFAAYWVRLVADRGCVASASFDYR